MGELDGEVGERPDGINGNVYVVLCGSNYDSPKCRQIGWGPIDQQISAQFIKKVMDACPYIADSRVFLGNDMIKDNVYNGIQEMCQEVTSEDTFFLYYAGHGDQLDDVDGDAGIDAGDPATWTGKDQAMVMLNPAQDYCPEPRDRDAWFVDDDLAELITPTC